MKIGETITTIVVPTVTAITGALVFLLDGQVKSFDKKLKDREAARLELAEQREAAQQMIDVRFRIYDAVTKSLETPNEQRQEVAIALVRGMLNTDDPLRLGLLAVLGSSGTSSVQTQATKLLEETSKFTQQQDVIPLDSAPPPSADWRAYNIDLFWCSASGTGLASRIAERLRDNDARGRVRVRELARSINASPGYRITGLVIRREGQEAEVAESVKAVADAEVNTKEKFLVTASRQRTPGYLSLFVCN
jgi:hypothetical protein